MKCALVFSQILIAALVLADGAPLAPPPKQSPSRRRKSEVFLSRTGGFISRRFPGSSFVFADLRSDPSLRRGEIDAIQEECQIPVVRRVMTGDRRTPVQVATDLLSNPEEVGGVAVLFDGAANQPVLTVFPENRITLVNVTPLAVSVGKEVFLSRLVKEMWRAICYTAGGTCASTPHCVMQAILQPADLDRVKCSMANPDVTGQIRNNARRYGFGTIETSTYRSACREGWAPAPTNDAQQAIWDRYRVAPAPTSDVQRAVWDEVKSGRARGGTTPARGTTAGAGK